MARKGLVLSAAACASLAGQVSAFAAPLAGAGALRGAPVQGASRPPTAPAAAAVAPEVGNALRLGSALAGAAGLAVAASVQTGRRRTAGAAKATVVPVTARKAVAVGDAIPNIGLDQGFPPEKFMLGDFCKGKKVVLVGLPGAFTPTWSSRQVPGYLEKEAELKAKGVTDVLVYCVNDGAVMTAWAADQGVAGSIITMLGDPRSELTETLGLVLDAPGPMSVLGNPRCKRFSMLIDDGVVKTFNVAASEEDPAGDTFPEVTLVEKMLEDL